MSNSKISALSSATSPLAGTETLPIVQSSATKQVSVANLTAGRNVDTAKLTSTDVEVSGSSYAARTVKLLPNTGDPAYYATFTDNIDANMTITKVIFGKTTTSLVFYDGNTTNSNGNFVVGTSGKGIVLPGGITWTSGSGSPEGVVTAPVGSLYSRSDGGLLTSLYVKQSGSGNTGWAGK
jgi:hypothetical protein